MRHRVRFSVGVLSLPNVSPNQGETEQHGQRTLVTRERIRADLIVAA